MNLTDLDISLQFLKGVGPVHFESFKKLGLRTLLDLLYYFPRSYDDRSQALKISEIFKLLPEEVKLFAVIEEQQVLRLKKINILKLWVSDGTGRIQIIFYNQIFLQKTLTPGSLVYFTAYLKNTAHQVELAAKSYEKIVHDSPALRKEITPVYSQTERLSSAKIRQAVKNLFENLPKVLDPFASAHFVPEHLPSLEFALRQMHFPVNRLHWKQAHQRLVFDDFFYMEYPLLYRRYINLNKPKTLNFIADGVLLRSYAENLPFALTSAQKRVMAEIRSEMCSAKNMTRLVQGDVGSGKTEVAFYAMLLAINSGYQAVLLAPTEILAYQHFLKLQKRVLELHLPDLKIDFLSGSVLQANREKCLKDLASGQTKILVGTHALFQDPVQYHQLGLIVIDEQHRFGVSQRDKLRAKGKNPDLLVMTATPIPRSLALSLYGDLDVSVIDELPPGRKPIQTVFFQFKDKHRVIVRIKEELLKGAQVYVVYPLIQESAKLDLQAAEEGYQEFKDFFPDFAVGLLHGQMKAADKEAVMQSFKNQKIKILVSTTVIEVGVDVPTATVMLIVNSERFGLSQLHQLRGRVGRGAEASYCFLLGRTRSEESKKRMQAMVATQDGFKLAELDLQLRGQGDLLGTRQSGLPSLLLADLSKDQALLEMARHSVTMLLNQDPELKENPLIKKELHRRLGQVDLNRLN